MSEDELMSSEEFTERLIRSRDEGSVDGFIAGICFAAVIVLIVMAIG